MMGPGGPEAADGRPRWNRTGAITQGFQTGFAARRFLPGYVIFPGL